MLDEIKDVGASVWISASAGTGKTKSLIDRILALLLNGATPSKILCLKIYVNTVRRLYEKSLISSEWVQIKTIHSFFRIHPSPLRSPAPCPQCALLWRTVKLPCPLFHQTASHVSFP